MSSNARASACACSFAIASFCCLAPSLDPLGEAALAPPAFLGGPAAFAFVFAAPGGAAVLAAPPLFLPLLAGAGMLLLGQALCCCAEPA